jgi:hypothetical protein
MNECGYSAGAPSPRRSGRQVGRVRVRLPILASSGAARCERCLVCVNRLHIGRARPYARSCCASRNHGPLPSFCQAEDKDTYMRFLEGGLPLESQLLHSDQLRQWYKHHRSRGHISSKHEGVQALSLTFLAQRIVSNPTYYDCKGTRDEHLSRIIDELEESN